MNEGRSRLLTYKLNSWEINAETNRDGATHPGRSNNETARSRRRCGDQRRRVFWESVDVGLRAGAGGIKPTSAGSL